MALDARIIEALRVLAAVVAAEGIDLVVIGAAVPLVLLDLRHGRPAGGRETRDVDVVVRVDSWEDFGRLRDNLLARGFRPVPTVPHRLLFGPDEHHAEVDLLPWSDRLAPDGTLRWPGSDVHMSTLGFAEAFACARPEPLANDLALPMVTLPASALLKLIAYRDRPADRALDLVDLVYYFERYEDEPGGARWELFDVRVDGEAVLYEEAGAYLLGREVAALARPESLAAAREVLAGIGDEYAPPINQLLAEEQRRHDEARRRELWRLFRVFTAGLIGSA